MENRKFKLFYIMLAIFLFSIVLGCAEKKITATQQPIVMLSSPSDGGNISMNEPIIGDSTGVYNSGLHLYVLINPVSSGNKWWVQPEAAVSSDGSWHANVQFGRPAQEDPAQEDIGAKYWVTAIVTSDTLSVGQIDYPSEVKFSAKPILLTRTASTATPISTAASTYTSWGEIIALITAIIGLATAFIYLIKENKK